MSRPAGRPKETVNGGLAAKHLKDKHQMRCSTEVRAYCTRAKTTCPLKGDAMISLLDKAADEARRNKLKTVQLEHVRRAHEAMTGSAASTPGRTL